jgi:hypothetical protein
MKPKTSQSQKEANKPKPSQNESEPIEPHELASQMTSDQLGKLLEELMKLPPPKKSP